jgi:glycosyltransferase involved in cell wall biosynthesis
MVHRVDGPISVYRGTDDEIDRRIWQINQDLSDATIFQSGYSRRRHEDMGLPFKNARVIHNAADPDIFHARGRRTFDRRKVRLIATSWSDNPNKGADVYAWLEQHLDWTRFEFTFIGRSAVSFQRIRSLPPLASEPLADELRQHDIFVTASRHESCSNALIEALSCGLPALCIDSGGNREILGEGGFAFSDREELPALLDRLIEEYPDRQSRISAPSIAAVADAYLDAMALGGRPDPA